MATDPICGMTVSTSSPLFVSKDNQTYYFCSKHCLEKFSCQENLVIDPAVYDEALVRGPWTFLKNKVFIVSAVLAAGCLLSFVVPVLVPFRQTLFLYFGTIWWAILLGLVIGGVIDHYVPREIFSYLLARPKKRTIVYAVGLGFLMSVCNHGILAIAMQLHKKGASTPAVIAFLLSSPWANFPLTLMLVGFFGVSRALYIILSAIVVALVTGLIYQVFERHTLVERNKNTVIIAEDYSVRNDLWGRIRSYRFSGQQLKVDMKGIFSGGMALSNMVLWWILLGTGLASLFGAYIPHHVFNTLMGPTVKGMLVTLLLATVIEVCSEGTAPLAFEIYRQTGAVGNSLAFLMAGVVTDYTEIGLIWHNVGRRAAMWLPVVTVPQVLALGFLANRIF